MTRRQSSRRSGSLGDGKVVGLDIGATAVRAAELTFDTADGRPQVTLTGIGQVDLPPGTVANGVVQDVGALTAAVKQLWRENKLGSHEVILGVANQQAVVRDLQMPNLAPAQRAKALPFQAKEVVALPIDEVVLDYCQVGAPDPDTDLVRGLLIATPRQPVLNAVLAVERAGLRVVRVDLASFGSLRAIGDERHAVEAVVDLGAHLSTIVVHHHGVPSLVRTLARGGEQLTQHLVDRVGLEPHEAETLKCTDGLESANDEAVRAMIEGLRPLAAEIRTSIAYFRTTRDNATIEQLSLTGGAAHLRGLTAEIERQVGVRTRLLDPLQHVRAGKLLEPLRSGAVAPPSAVAVGLVMGVAA